MKLWRLYKKFPWLEYRHRLVAGLPRGASLLELGSADCDRARLFKSIRPDLKVFAADIRDLSKNAGPGIEFFVADATAGLPERFDGYFDCVTTMHLLEHLPPAACDAVAETVKRSLKPGGAWYIETPGTRSAWLPSFSLGIRRCNCPINFYDDPSHLKPFSKGGLYYLLSDRGFDVVRCGIARNLLFAALSPGLILAGLLLRKRMWFSIGLCNLIGWSVYAHAVKRAT